MTIEDPIQKKQQILLHELRMCDKQAKRLVYSLKHVKKIAPFTRENIVDATEQEIETIDAFILRFSRLQDILGKKIFRFLLEISGEELVIMIDVLNKMEKINIINDANEWMNIREIRNFAIHEYAEDDAQHVVDSLNKIINFSEELLVILNKVKQYITKELGLKY